MASDESNARWDDLVSIREDLDQGNEVVVPSLISRIDGKRHGLSPKATRFAEALAVDPSWSRIQGARSRRLAA